MWGEVWLVGCGMVGGGGLVGAAVYLERRLGAAQRRVVANAAVAAALQRFRSERRQRRAQEVRSWDRDFWALAGPPPQCQSTEHDHVADYSFAEPYRVRCVRRVSEADRARVVAVLAAGEHLVTADEIAERRRRMVEAWRSRGYL